MANDLENFTPGIPDPRLDALLDEALSADSVEGGIPAGLSDRVFAAARAELAAEQPVLARLGAWRTFAMAASVLLLVGGALWLSVREREGTGPTIVKSTREVAAPQATATPALAFDEDDVDRELDLLEVQVGQYADNTRWSGTTTSEGSAIDEMDFQTDAAVF
jgi:hypothetical protein